MKPDQVEMEAANEAMEKFRRADKQNDHLHPWVAYREGFVHGRSTMEAKLAASEARERVLREALDNYAAPRNCGSHYCDWHMHANNQIAKIALKAAGEIK